MRSTNDFWKARRILVTGGSAGLGRALAAELSGAGARVAVVARDPDRLATVKATLPGVHVIQADVADKEAVYPLLGEAAGVLGGAVDVLINNASALGPTPLRLLADTDCEDLEHVLVTNLIGPFRLAKAALPGMLLGGTGLIVNVSSDAAVSAYPAWGSYAASKAGLDQLSRVLDAEVRDQGVRCLAIDPGDMRTALHFAAIPDADPAELRDPVEVARALGRFLPLAVQREDSRYAAAAWRAALEAAGERDDARAVAAREDASC